MEPEVGTIFVAQPLDYEQNKRYEASYSWNPEAKKSSSNKDEVTHMKTNVFISSGSVAVKHETRLLGTSLL